MSIGLRIRHIVFRIHFAAQVWPMAIWSGDGCGYIPRCCGGWFRDGWDHFFTGKPWENHGKTMGKPWENHGKTMGKPGFDVPQKTNPVITTVGTVTQDDLALRYNDVSVLENHHASPGFGNVVFSGGARGRARGGPWLNHCMFIPNLAISSNKKTRGLPKID